MRLARLDSLRIANRFSPYLAGTVIVAALLVPSVARADPASDAKDLFARGRDLRAAGDCNGAVSLFRKATELYPAGLGSLRNLAECEEQLGHFASSRRAWLDLKRSLVTEDARKYDGWSQDADLAAARLAPKLARVTVDVNVVGPDGAAADARAVDVTLDGEPLAQALLGTALERDPGRHVVRVAGARVHEPQQKVIDLVAGDASRVALRVTVTPDKVDPNDVVPVPQPGAPAPSAATTAAPDDPASQSRATRRTVGWVIVGIGGAALVGAGISLGIRQGDLSQVDSCPNTGCNPSLRSTVSQGHTATTLFDVLGPIGLVGVGGGLALVLTAGSGSQTSGLVITPHLGGATASWSF
jgi:hypothetical protein